MIPSSDARRIRLCPLADIPAEGAIGFKIDTPNGARDIFVVRRADTCYAYLNSCPHTGVSLDWQPNQFLDSDGALIQCSTHGALFRIEDGLCIYGPCVNRSLTAIRTEIGAGQVYLLI